VIQKMTVCARNMSLLFHSIMIYTDDVNRGGGGGETGGFHQRVKAKKCWEEAGMRDLNFKSTFHHNKKCYNRRSKRFFFTIREKLGGQFICKDFSNLRHYLFNKLKKRNACFFLTPSL
jgi:hypothetical protein